jgi:uncharacterized protein (DUF302 family)
LRELINRSLFFGGARGQSLQVERAPEDGAPRPLRLARGAVPSQKSLRGERRRLEMGVEGLITIESRLGPRETTDRLSAAVAARGMAVLARIDHAKAAHGVGLTLRPTEVLVFGNPKAGTPLMQSAQTLGIDLPLKALVWQDEGGKTWISWNDPHWLAARHGAADGHEPALAAMAAALAAVAAEAAGRAGADDAG